MKQEMVTEENLDKLKKHAAQRTRCEVYSRIVGYLRPVSQWNVGKKEEFKDRQTYDSDSTRCC